MDKKPRIAFCFSWQARTLDQTYQLFQQNLFDAAKEQWFDYDIFCAVEDDEDVVKVELLNPTKVEKIKSSEVRKIIDEKWWHFIEIGVAGKYCMEPISSINQLQQFYKISQSIKIKNKYKSGKGISYDIVFRLRFDCPFPRKLNFNNIFDKVRSSKKIVLGNRNKMEPSYKFIVKMEDFYFIMDDEASNVLWDIFEKWDVCYKWFEVKYKKLYKVFGYIRNALDYFYKKSPLIALCFSIPFSYIFEMFFHSTSAEIVVLNYFKNMKCEVDTNTYITIWFVKNKKKYSKRHFATHTKKWMFRKWKYEL